LRAKLLHALDTIYDSEGTVLAGLPVNDPHGDHANWPVDAALLDTSNGRTSAKLERS
jgi:hypothetical protein